MFDNNKYLELIRLSTISEQAVIMLKIEKICQILSSLTTGVEVYDYEEIYLNTNKFNQFMNSYFETKKQIENLEKDLKQNDKHTTKK